MIMDILQYMMKSMKLLLCLSLAFMSAAGVQSGSPANLFRFFSGMRSPEEPRWPPSFCNKLDCPYYSVLEETDEYELRQYNASRWVETSEQGVDFDQASHDEFMRLFDYISGKNTQKMKIDMTAPVIQQIIPGPGPACENDFTMNFYIAPKVYHPPPPSDPKVQIKEMKQMKVYVRSFGGYAGIKDWLNEAAELQKTLEEKSAKYIDSYFFAAGYDSPFKPFNRHNEVWLLHKDT